MVFVSFKDDADIGRIEQKHETVAFLCLLMAKLWRECKKWYIYECKGYTKVKSTNLGQLMVVSWDTSYAKSVHDSSKVG